MPAAVEPELEIAGSVLDGSRFLNMTEPFRCICKFQSIAAPRSPACWPVSGAFRVGEVVVPESRPFGARVNACGLGVVEVGCRRLRIRVDGGF